MREDLDTLYHRAMRSTDKDFMNEVFMLLIEDDKFDEAKKLDERLDNLMVHAGHETIFIYSPSKSKIAFLIGDSQMGQDWYKTR